MRGRGRCPSHRTACGLLYTAGLLVAALAAVVGPVAAVPAQDSPLEPPRVRAPATTRVDTTGPRRPARAATLGEADRFIDSRIDGEPVSIFIGNVYIDRDSLTARADTGYYYRARETYELLGRVRLRQRESVLTCRRALYRREEGAADFFGGVRLEDEGGIGTGRRGESRRNGRLFRLIGDALVVTPTYSVWADTLVRDDDLAQAEAFGNVRIVNPVERQVVTGDHAVFDYPAGRIATVDRRPRVVSRDRTADLLEGTARFMRFFRMEERAVMIDSVRIVQGRTEALADTAWAFGRDRIVLRGSPRVAIGQESSMEAAEIEFHYEGSDLREIMLRGDARMIDSGPDSLASIYTGLPAFDVLDGDSITVVLADGRVRQSVVVGSAHSVYVPMDLRDEVAFNDVTGDTIIIDFHRQRVRRVRVIGNMNGSYHVAKTATFAARSDSAAAALADTAAVAAPDTSLGAATAAADTAGSDFEAAAERVDYSGHSVTFDLAARTIDIEGDGELIYGTMNLKAQRIELDTEERELYASGEPLLEDRESIAGDRMGYNFGARTGAVHDGVTTFDNNFYEGDAIRRFPDGTLKIKGGKMTSCDLEEPHYHIWADEMKMKLGDKIVARPVVMKVGHVPVFALPFYFKSLKSGRRSGILFPNFNFGWTGREGRYIRDFGYYWATNDYMDFTFEADFNERRDLGWRIGWRYNVRYSFSGSAVYTRKVSLDAARDLKEWQLRWNHRQDQLWDDYKFSTDVSMASQTLSSNDLSSTSGRDIVSGQLRSSAYLSRSFDFMNASLNASRDERVNAADDDPTNNNLLWSMSLPSLTLSFRQITLAPSLRAGRQGSFWGDLLRNTYFQQSYALGAGWSESELTRANSQRASGNWSLNIRPPRLAFLSASAGVSGAQAWDRSHTEGVAVDRSDTTYTPFEETLEETNPSLSLNTNLATTLYGIFPLRIGALQAIRHTLRLSAGYSYRPQLGSKQPRSQSVSLAVGNRFDVKYAAPTAGGDSTVSKKLDGLVDWQLGTGYNPDAERQWSNVNSTLIFKPGQSRNLNFKVNNTIDPYDWVILSTRLTYGLNLGGRFDTGGGAEVEEQRRNAGLERLGVQEIGAVRDSLAALADSLDQDPFADEMLEPAGARNGAFSTGRRREGGGSGQRDATEGGRYIPWQLGASFSYAKNRGSSASSSRGNISVSANPTTSWEFSYRASFDLAAGLITRQEWSLNRDLHCWRLEFSRIISSVDQQFAFRIYLQSIPDVKLTSGQEDILGSAAGFGGALLP